MAWQTVNSQFTAAVNDHHEGFFNSTLMLKSGQPAIRVSKWTVSPELGVQT